MKTLEFHCQHEGERLDVYLAGATQRTRSNIQGLIHSGHVTVNQKIRKANYKLCAGDRVLLHIPKPVSVDIEPQDIALDIVYQDDDIAVINKPKGLVVHPATGNESGTLVNALMYHMTLSGINGELRPGIVHRIDKDTSGLLVIAKNDDAHIFLAEQIKRHAVERLYGALVHGNLEEDTGVVDAPIGRHPKDRKRMAVLQKGREACTHYTVLERFGEATLLDIALKTGRTHQIRVHMQHIRHPLLGDKTYGGKPSYQLKSQALHARQLTLTHPRTKQKMTFAAPFPQDFLHALNALRDKQG
ncbi:MAG: RluA family pseudouridine synthase [Christensenellales bacterium]|jgi:23S rRNA pseudouridine1911/1915/1917 synthase